VEKRLICIQKFFDTVKEKLIICDII